MITIIDSLKLPKGYTKTKEEFPKMDYPTKKGSIYRLQNEETRAVVLTCMVPEEVSMPFDNPNEMLQGLRESLLKEAGLVELKNGKNKKGHPFVYYIVKQHIEEYPGNYYMLNLNIKSGKTVYFINACFDEIGITGQRDSAIFELLSRQKGGSTLLEEWSRDPLDASYEEGFLMNLSEKERYDDLFPQHPLTMARRLVKFVIENN